MKQTLTRLPVLFLCALFALIAALLLPHTANAAASWTVTQHAGSARNRGTTKLFYSITDDKNRLILIDGGWEADADAVRQIIAKHGNHVYAWFITHPHPDHVGAFNKIMSSPGSIKVDIIYTTHVNAARYRATALSYDDYPTYTKFCRVIKGRRVKYLKENDIIWILGLRVRVLHAWDANVDRMSGQLCNNGSLMLRFNGRKRSILFCADPDSRVEAQIIRKQKYWIRCTYVQCAHHGNWGLTAAFYKLTGAKAAFFDGPGMLYQRGQVYDGYRIKEYFQKIGATLYMLDSAPHSVRLI